MHLRWSALGIVLGTLFACNLPVSTAGGPVTSNKLVQTGGGDLVALGTGNLLDDGSGPRGINPSVAPVFLEDGKLHATYSVGYGLGGQLGHMALDFVMTTSGKCVYHQESWSVSQPSSAPVQGTRQLDAELVAKLFHDVVQPTPAPPLRAANCFDGPMAHWTVGYKRLTLIGPACRYSELSSALTDDLDNVTDALGLTYVHVPRPSPSPSPVAASASPTAAPSPSTTLVPAPPPSAS